MNHYVPDFEIDDDYSTPTSSGLTRPKKSAMAEHDIMELLWQNGQVVIHNQTQRSHKKSPPSRDDNATLPADQPTAREIRSSSQHDNHNHNHNHQQQQQQSTTDSLFMQEDEMASWLHYPLNDANFDGDFCADLLYAAPCVTPTSAAQMIRTAHTPEPRPTVLRPPIPPERRTELDTRVQNFSSHKARPESGPSSSKTVVRESTVVDSSVTPTAVGSESRGSSAVKSTEGPSGRYNACGTMSGAAVAATSSAAAECVNGFGNGGSKEVATCEVTVTSSPGDSTASAEQDQKPPVEDRKRKGREVDDIECHSEDVDFESADAKKQTRGSTSTKRSRAAEVHNLSERKRRDRINEKMKALQELIPRCNKSDKASMLDEAIEYLKSLQLQVQMMSMGCGLVPMMFPGVQQYMTPMGMGMGMGMGMNRPMMPFPNVLAGSTLPTPAAAAHLGPRFPVPGFQMPPAPAPDPSRMQATSQSDPMLNSFGMQNPNQPRIPSFADPYQQYLGLHQMQVPLVQNQAIAQPSSSKPSASREAENLEKHQEG